MKPISKMDWNEWRNEARVCKHAKMHPDNRALRMCHAHEPRRCWFHLCWRKIEEERETR